MAACGSTSVAGAGGSGGSGGGHVKDPFPQTCAPPDVAAVCDGQGKKLCGNGAVDTCQVCSSSDGGPTNCMDVSEECDGADLHGASCASLGYPGSGDVACGATCSLDARDCDSCTGSAQQLACARPRVDAFDIASLALASDGKVIAAAWTTFDRFLHFARFDADLKLIDERGCMSIADGLHVALSATPSGWLLAVGGTGDNPSVVVHRLDPQGAELGARTITGATWPVLASRAGKAPLLVYTATNFAAGNGEIKAELLDDQASAIWSKSIYPKAFPELTTAAFADPGFVISVWAADTMPPVAQEIAVDEAGAVGMPSALSDAHDVALGAGGPGRVVAAVRTSSGYAVGFLDGTGKLAGSLTTVAPLDPIKATQEHQTVFAGGRAVVIVSEKQDTSVSVAHVGASGDVAIPLYPLATEPSGISWTASTALGETAVFAWTNFVPDPVGSRFILAKVKP